MGRWRKIWSAIRAIAAHADPLAESANWIALTIGSHLPIWPLYVIWAAGWQAWPSSIFTIAASPFFLAVPWIASRGSLAARVTLVVVGIANTVFTIWVLGSASRTDYFFAACLALMPTVFRWREFAIMVGLIALTSGAWLAMGYATLPGLHHYNATANHGLRVLNGISVAILIAFFAWLRFDTWRQKRASA